MPCRELTGSWSTQTTQAKEMLGGMVILKARSEKITRSGFLATFSWLRKYSIFSPDRLIHFPLQLLQVRSSLVYKSSYMKTFNRISPR